jgi:hypothetical protein
MHQCSRVVVAAVVTLHVICKRFADWTKAGLQTRRGRCWQLHVCFLKESVMLGKPELHAACMQVLVRC